MTKSFSDVLINFIQDTGFLNITWQQSIMILVACILIYLAIKKEYEPLLLLPIAFGMLLANLPLAGLMAEPGWKDRRIILLYLSGVEKGYILRLYSLE